MSTFLSTLGRWSFRHPWRVLVAWILALGIVGGGALTLMSGTDNSFTIPGTESQTGLEQLQRTFPQASGASAQIIVVADEGHEVTDADYRDPIEDAVDAIDGIDEVNTVTSPYDENVSGMVSDDGVAGIIRIQFDGESMGVTAEAKQAVNDAVDDLRDALPEAAQTELGGELFAVSIPGVTVTELVGLIIALLVLIVTFRSFVVAGLPLLTAVLGVGISMAGIFAATAFTSVSSTTPLLALMLGLAVGIDYALFIVSRHQDQVREGVDPEESAARATGTAGSAVVFAGITVLIALIGLGFAGIPFLTTMGVAASVAVAIAVLIAVTLTPALLGFVKGRVVGRPRRARNGKKGARRTAAKAENADEQAQAAPRLTASGRWVRIVTKHPVLTSLAVVIGLGVVAIPSSSLALALPNAGVLAEGTEARTNYDLTAEHFGPGFNGPLILTGTIVTSTDPLTLMEDLGDEIESIPGVAEVALATPNETADTGIIQLIPETAPDAPETADLVRELRAQHDRLLDEFDVDLKVTGYTAVAIDVSDQLGAALLPFGVFVIGLSLVLLTIVFRSLWVPLTATLGYLLSIVAAFGAVAAVFEWGWFADALHLARVGPVISFMPIILMGVLFGLAMDYQVFLVSRMREDYVHDPASKDPRTRREAAVRAVRSGFSGSARVVTAAAVIMFAVFVAFVPEGDSSIKPIAFGLAVGIAIDAFLVRMTLIPALMTILGERAWAMPAWLERVLPHVDIEGEAVERERTLASWPGDDSVAAADDLVLDDGRGRTSPVSFRLAEGSALVVTGADAQARTTFALLVAGRIPAEHGKLRVAGHLLPGRAAWVRAHVGFVPARSEDPAGSLREALRGRTSIVLLDGLDAYPQATRDQLAALLRDRRERRPLAVLATASAPSALRTLLADAGWPRASVLDLDQDAPAAQTRTSSDNDTAEVAS